MKKLKEFLSENWINILAFVFSGIPVACAFLYGIYKVGEMMYNDLDFGSVLFGVIITILVRAIVDQRAKDKKDLI
jgi:hypothetical protein